MTLDQHIANFVRDAQYRIGKLSAEIDALEDEGSYQYQKKFRERLELSLFMDIAYEGKWLITDDEFNHLQIDDTWTEREVIQEIQHLRYFSQMNEMPFINFTGHYPKLINIGGGTSDSGSEVEFPQGVAGQILAYNGSGNVYAATLNSVQGHNDESINSFFS